MVLFYGSSFAEISLRSVGQSETETYSSQDIIGRLLFAVAYFKERVVNVFTIVNTGGITLNTDGSSTQRIVGSLLYSLNILEQRPLLGSGLGGENLKLIFKIKNFYSIDYLAFHPSHIIPITFTISTFYSHLIGAGGILSLLFFYFIILGQILLNKKTIFYGIVVLILGFASGGFLDLQTWVSFAFCIVLQEKIKEKI